MTGPTAVGKSQIAYKLAKFIGSEIIAADSISMFKHYNIGASKPTEKMRDSIKYHLLDHYDPTESVDAPTHADLVRKTIKSFPNIPIIEGGASFYINQIIYPIEEYITIPDEIPDQVDEIVDDLGDNWKTVVETLNEQYPGLDLSGILSNDYYRVKKALIHHLAGINPQQSQNPVHDIDFRVFYFYMDRLPLYRRIDARCEQMVQQGLIQEVLDLIREGHYANPDKGPEKSIGYSDAYRYIKTVKEAEDFAQVPENFRSFLHRFMKNSQQLSKK